MKRILSLALPLLAFALNAQVPVGLNAGTVHDAINTLYPGVVTSVSMPNQTSAYISSWSATATDAQKAQVNAYLASLDFTLLNAQQVYNANYAAFNAKTAAIEAAGFTYQGGTFHADTKGISNMQSMMIAASALTYPYTIYDMNSTWTFNSASDVVATGAQVLGFVAGIENAAKPLRDALAQQSGETSAAWLARMQAWKETRP